MLSSTEHNFRTIRWISSEKPRRSEPRRRDSDKKRNLKIAESLRFLSMEDATSMFR
jgi:hypothetical protein